MPRPALALAPALALVLALALALAACRSDSKVDPAYSRDIDRICHVERHSGADQDETAARPIIAAEWLGRNLETQAARDFLATVARLDPAAKPAALRAEAKRTGVAGCPTAAAWEQAP